MGRIVGIRAFGAEIVLQCLSVALVVIALGVICPAREIVFIADTNRLVFCLKLLL